MNVTGNGAATSAGHPHPVRGTLAGTGTLTVSGTFTWTGGTQTDAGNTTIASTATLTIGAGDAAVSAAARSRTTAP